MIYYFIQLLIFQALFLGVYELFLKKETFFSLNRAYLLITPFLAAVIPFLEFEILKTVVPTSEMVQLPVLYISEGNAQTNIINDGMEGSFSTYSFLKANLLTIVYFFGLLLSLALFTRKLLFLQNRLRNGKIEKRNKITIVRIPDSRMACSFFNIIFLGEKLPEKEALQILAHELAHVEQKHSWDLLWFEILRIVLWFNPFIYRQQTQLSIVHEYIADEKAVQNFEKKSYFQDLLNITFGTRQISFTNQFFNKSLIKKRIIMLQKPKSNRNAKLKYLLVLPLMFAMLTYVSCSEDRLSNSGNNNYELIDGKKVKTFKVESFKSITEEKEAEIVKIIQQIGNRYDKVVVTDGRFSLIFNQSVGYENGFLLWDNGNLEYLADQIGFSNDGKPMTAELGDPGVFVLNEETKLEKDAENAETIETAEEEFEKEFSKMKDETVRKRAEFARQQLEESN